jgi:UDP-glucose 4-epimerase
VARANLAAATQPLPKAGRLDARGFNIGTGIETPVTGLADVMRSVAGPKGAAATIMHAPARPGEQMRSSVKVDKAARVLGWRPTVTLEAGVRETYDYFARVAK